jgi:hypothetical protein
MSDIKDIWNVFKMSNMQDKDMQAMFRRHATPNACIELLEEIEILKAKIQSSSTESFIRGYHFARRFGFQFEEDIEKQAMLNFYSIDRGLK